MEEINDTSKKQPVKNNNSLIIIIVLVAAALISLLFYKQKVEVLKEKQVVKNLTDNWQIIKSDKYGFQFKYPNGWQIQDLTADGAPKEDPRVIYVIKDEVDGYKNTITMRVSEQRTVGYEDPENAIQISIPFDKKNFIILSTSTNSDKKVEFYNIPTTLDKISK